MSPDTGDASSYLGVVRRARKDEPGEPLGGGPPGSRNWLPRPDGSRTDRLLPMRVVVPWDRVALGLELPVVPGKPMPNPVVRAREFERALATAASAADVARVFGVTRASVCQYLTLLRRLPQDLLDKVEAERTPEKLKVLTLRRLLGVAQARERGGASPAAEGPRRAAAVTGGDR